MPKTVPALLRTHLNGNTTSLATLWRITRRDGVVNRYCDADLDVTVPGDGTYSSLAGFERTAVQSKIGASVDNLDILGIITPQTDITAVALRNGVFDGARVEVFLVNWASPADGTMAVMSGFFGEVIVNPAGFYQVELRGLTSVLADQTLNATSPTCRASLGDAKCRVPIDPPTVVRSTAYVFGQYVKVALQAGSDYRIHKDRIFFCIAPGTTAASSPTYVETINSVTTDGTAEFVCLEAWTRMATIATVVSPFEFTVAFTGNVSTPPDGWFQNGTIESQLASRYSAAEIRASLTGGSIFTFLPASDIVVNGVVRLTKGCDKNYNTCNTVFRNAANFRGEPFLPIDPAKA